MAASRDRASLQKVLGCCFWGMPAVQEDDTATCQAELQQKRALDYLTASMPDGVVPGASLHHVTAQSKAGRLDPRIGKLRGQPDEVLHDSTMHGFCGILDAIVRLDGVVAIHAEVLEAALPWVPRHRLDAVCKSEQHALQGVTSYDSLALIVTMPWFMSQQNPCSTADALRLGVALREELNGASTIWNLQQSGVEVSQARWVVSHFTSLALQRTMINSAAMCTHANALRLHSLAEDMLILLPDSPTNRWNVAWALIAKGEHRKATAELNKAAILSHKVGNHLMVAAINWCRKALHGSMPKQPLAVHLATVMASNKLSHLQPMLCEPLIDLQQ